MGQVLPKVPSQTLSSPADPQNTLFALTPCFRSWEPAEPWPTQLLLVGPITAGPLEKGARSPSYLYPAAVQLALPKGSPSSAMALMRLLARTCTCFPLVRL